jgi:hypothetical protein
MELPWCLSGPRESVWALAFSNDQFDRQVEEDGAEGASLLDTKVDGGLRVFYQGGGGGGRLRWLRQCRPCQSSLLSQEGNPYERGW